MKTPLLSTILATLTLGLPQSILANDSTQATLDEIQLRLIKSQANPVERPAQRKADPFATRPLRKPTGITFDVRFDNQGKMRLKAEGPLARIRSLVDGSNES